MGGIGGAIACLVAHRRPGALRLNRPCDDGSVGRLLVDESDAENPRTVAADIDESGDLVFSGRDWGPGVEQFFGRDEIEFWYTVRRGDLAAYAGAASVDPERPLDSLHDRWFGDRFNELAALMRTESGDLGFEVEYSLADLLESSETES